LHTINIMVVNKEVKMKEIKFVKKVFIKGKIKCLTGLHIGGSDQALSIGGVDNVVLRDPITNLPYIPGSSIKGKMRSLLEKFYGLADDDEKHPVYTPDKDTKRGKEPPKEGMRLCQIFGVPAESEFSEPPRLIVRDAFMTEETKNILEKLETDFPYSEVKTEVVINRVTSHANPRQMERIPAGSEFNFQFIVNIFEGDKEDEIIEEIFKAMKLLQDDYLGGSGTRGYGRIKFSIDELTYRDVDIYNQMAKEKEYEKEIPEELK